MAKRATVKKKIPDELAEQLKQFKQLKQSMETYSKHRIECWCCNASDSTRDQTEDQYAGELYEEGWRFVVSEKFQTAGIVCPRCAALPDEKRGEWDTT